MTEETICPDCRGSGEGQNEHTRCLTCKGSGTTYIEESEEE